MGKRPLCIFSCIILTAVVLFLAAAEQKGPPDAETWEQTEVVGEVYYREEGTNSSILYLKDVSIRKGPKGLSCKQCIVYLSKGTIYPIGTIIQATGTLRTMESPGNPGQFDERIYGLGRGISWKLFGNSSKIEQVSEGSWRERLVRLKERLCLRLDFLFEEEAAAVLKAMLFGADEELSPELRKDYQTAGIGHLLAISGLHVTLLGGTLYRMLRKAGLPYLPCAVTAGGLLLLYREMLGFRVSSIRAVGMFLIFLAAQTIGRAYDRLTALSVLAVAVVAGNPYQVFSSGFWLSFLAAAGASVALEWLEEEKRVREETAEQDGQRKLFSMLFVPLYLQAVTLPIQAWAYCEIPVYSLFWNLLLVPLAGIALGFGLLSLIVSGLSWTAGCFAGGPAGVILKLYQGACSIGARIPGAVYICGRPKLWQMLLYYAALIAVTAVFWPRHQSRPQDGRRGFGTEAESGRRCRWLRRSTLTLYLAAGIGLLFVRFHAPLEVTFLDVGQGDCAVIRERGGLCMLVDGGSSDVKQVGEYRILPFLKYSKIPHVDYVFVSHGDADHISGILELLKQQEISVGGVVCWEQASDKLDGVKQLAEEQGIPVWNMRAGSCLETDSMRMCCLGPENSGEAAGRSENNQSLVLRLEYRGLKVMFTGDMEEEEEAGVLDTIAEELLRADVLKTAHHGSSSSTTGEFLEAVSPKAAVISCGRDNSYGHPDAQTVARLKTYMDTVLVTAESGAVELSWNGRSLRLVPYRKKSACQES